MRCRLDLWSRARRDRRGDGKPRDAETGEKLTSAVCSSQLAVYGHLEAAALRSTQRIELWFAILFNSWSENEAENQRKVRRDRIKKMETEGAEGWNSLAVASVRCLSVNRSKERQAVALFTSEATDPAVFP